MAEVSTGSGGAGWVIVSGGGRAARVRLVVELIGQGATVTAKDGPRGSREEHRVVGRDLGRVQDENPARPTKERAGRAGLEVGLEWVGVAAGALVQDHEVRIQAAAVDIAVPLHELADQ